MTDRHDDHVTDVAFQRIVTNELLPALQNSAIGVSLCPSKEGLDAKFCVELGAMICLDKPIIAVVAPGRTISKKLEMVADAVVHADLATEEGKALVMEAINSLPIKP